MSVDDPDYERRRGIDRRSGIDRRVTMLETNYTHILDRLAGIDGKFTDLDALKNQIQGMVYLVRFVGYGGILAMVAMLVNYLAKP